MRCPDLTQLLARMARVVATLTDCLQVRVLLASIGLMVCLRLFVLVGSCFLVRPPGLILICAITSQASVVPGAAMQIPPGPLHTGGALDRVGVGRDVCPQAFPSSARAIPTPCRSTAPPFVSTSHSAASVSIGLDESCSTLLEDSLQRPDCEAREAHEAEAEREARVADRARERAGSRHSACFDTQGRSLHHCSCQACYRQWKAPTCGNGKVLKDFTLQLQARRAVLEPSRHRRWVAWPRSMANHRLRCSTACSVFVKPQLLHLSNPPALTPLNILNAFQDTFACVCVFVICARWIPLLGGQSRYQNGWTQRAPTCATCFCIRTHCLCSYMLILLRLVEPRHM